MWFSSASRNQRNGWLPETPAISRARMIRSNETPAVGHCRRRASNVSSDGPTRRRRWNAASSRTMLSPTGTRGRDLPVRTSTRARPTPSATGQSPSTKSPNSNPYELSLTAEYKAHGSRIAPSAAAGQKWMRLAGHSCAAPSGGSARRIKKWVINSAVAMEERVASAAADPLANCALIASFANAPPVSGSPARLRASRAARIKVPGERFMPCVASAPIVRNRAALTSR